MSSINNLASEIMKQLQSYSDDVANEVDKAVDDVSNELKDNIAADSPKRKGEYRKGWRVKVAYSGKGNKRAIVHNKTSYQLTHLLEKGHATKNGKFVKGISHIKPNEEKAIPKFLKRIEKAVQGK